MAVHREEYGTEKTLHIRIMKFFIRVATGLVVAGVFRFFSFRGASLFVLVSIPIISIAGELQSSSPKVLSFYQIENSRIVQERRTKMNSNRKTAIIVGVLFIIATAAPIVSVVPLSVVPLGFLGSEGDPAYLTAISANEGQVLMGVLLWIAMAASVVMIPIMMFPILKKHSESLALGYVGARIFEGFFDAVNVISLLSLLSLSREFVDAGAPGASYFQTSGALLLAAIDWNSVLLDFPFLLSALVFNYLLYKSRLIPRWLSILGLIGGALWFATVPVRMFSLGPSLIEVLALPIAAQEMILAAWLIVKGFNSSAIAS